MYRLLVALLLVVAVASSFAQRNRRQWLGAETFILFKLDARTDLVIYGYGGYSHVATDVMGPTGTLAVLGRSFVPTVWKIIKDPGAPPARLATFVTLDMWQTRAVNANSVDPSLYVPSSPMTVFRLDITVSVFPPGEDPYITWGDTGMIDGWSRFWGWPSYQPESIGGEFQLRVGAASSPAGYFTTPMMTSERVYYVHDGGVDPRQQGPVGDEPDDFGQHPGEVPVGGGGTGGGSGSSADDPVNKPGFWESLFVPSAEKVQEYEDALLALSYWGPFQFWTEFQSLVSNIEVQEKSYIIELPNPMDDGTLDFDLTNYSGFIVIMRHLTSGVMWFVVILGVRKVILKL